MPKGFEGFQKGNKIRLGAKNSAETRKKISAANKGRISPFKGQIGRFSKETRERISKNSARAFLGKHHSKEYIKRLKERVGEKNPFYGKHHSEETRKKIGEAQRGEKGSSWKGGITPLIKRIRKSPEYKLWRTAVFERDNYACVWCGQIGGVLEVDHIKPFSQYPELRFSIDNGRVLCKKCHSETDTYMWKSRYYKK